MTPFSHRFFIWILLGLFLVVAFGQDVYVPGECKNIKNENKCMHTCCKWHALEEKCMARTECNDPSICIEGKCPDILPSRTVMLISLGVILVFASGLLFVVAYKKKWCINIPPNMKVTDFE